MSCFIPYGGIGLPKTTRVGVYCCDNSCSPKMGLVLMALGLQSGGPLGGLTVDYQFLNTLLICFALFMVMAMSGFP